MTEKINIQFRIKTSAPNGMTLNFVPFGIAVMVLISTYQTAEKCSILFY